MYIYIQLIQSYKYIIQKATPNTIDNFFKSIFLFIKDLH